LTPNQLVLLQLLYNKDYFNIKEIFGETRAIDIRKSLEHTPYILSLGGLFTDTIISNDQIEKLFGIRGDQINFWEFYQCYPIRVGTRVLRASGSIAQVAQKHEKKYLAKVKRTAQHELAIKATEAFINQQKRANKLQYLPNMETVLNNCMWEQWTVFIQENGVEEQEWNSDQI
tara:strand:+ start:1382 stop:1900 length:519 start_codon:yes stop_codon:yes gene_type:complete